MNAGVKYTLARIGLFILCAVPVVLLLPSSVDLLLKLLIAVVLSALLAFMLLGGIRDQVAESLVSRRERKATEREKLRSALAGDDTADRPDSNDDHR
jgi:hypothetical protein